MSNMLLYRAVHCSYNSKRRAAFVTVFLPPSSPIDIQKCFGTRTEEAPKYALESDLLFMSNNRISSLNQTN